MLPLDMKSIQEPGHFDSDESSAPIKQASLLVDVAATFHDSAGVRTHCCWMSVAAAEDADPAASYLFTSLDFGFVCDLASPHDVPLLQPAAPASYLQRFVHAAIPCAVLPQL